jgi:hypothetical protein
VRWTKGPWSWLLAAVWLLFAVLAVPVLQEDHTPGGLLVGGGAGAVGLFAGVRALISHVRLAGDELRYVGYLRTRRIPWTDVTGVDIDVLGSASPLESVGLVVRLADGTQVEVPAVAGFAFAGRNRRLERLRAKCERRARAAAGS